MMSAGGKHRPTTDITSATTGNLGPNDCGGGAGDGVIPADSYSYGRA